MCFPQAASTAQHSPAVNVSVPEVNEQLPAVTTYILKIKRTEKSSYKTTIDLVNKITANGSVKRTHLRQNCTKCLDIRLMKEDHTVLEEQRMTDPLFEEIEYRDEQGDFKWIEVKPDEKVIAIRTNLRSEVAMLQFRFSEDSLNKWVTVKL